MSQTFDRKESNHADYLAFLYKEIAITHSSQPARLALIAVINQCLSPRELDLSIAHRHLCQSDIEPETAKQLVNAAIAILDNAKLLDDNGKIASFVIERIKPQINKKRRATPLKSPMIWREAKQMGLRLMSGVDDRQLSLLSAKNQPAAFEAINYWQSTPFKLNPAFKEIADWQSGFEDWQLRALAKDYKGTFFFPSTLDHRTRNYYLSAINPSNTGDNKGIFRFAESKPVGKDGLKAIRIHLANLMGIKGSLAHRERWSIENGKEIYPAIKGRSLSEIRNQLGQKKVIQLYAVAKEYRTILNRGTNHPSGMILNQDASCSGIQISSTILRNPELARLVNLCASLPTDEPQDLYSEYVKRLIKALPKHWHRAIDRALAKPAVMYSCYGAGKTVIFYGDNGLIATLAASGNEELATELECSEETQAIFWDELAQVIKANLVYVQAIRKALEKHGDNPITWLTLDRLPVKSHPQILDPTCFDVLTLGGKRTIKLRNNNPALIDAAASIRKQQTSLPVHLTHSFDATHIRMTTLAAKKESIAIVHTHDDLGTHAATYWRTKEIIAEQFHALHSTDVLASVQKRNKINIEIQKGSYDLNECLKSAYMFS